MPSATTPSAPTTGTGHDVNPATGQPYEPHAVLQADFARALAEYWADGPKSETPPGHWNVLANEVSDSPGFALRIGGQGEPVDRLEWDVKLYLALNGAVHDAAIATWGVKGFYDSVRPISHDPLHGRQGPVERPGRTVVRPARACRSCPASSRSSPPSRARPGSGTPALAGHVGEIAISAWRGLPGGPEDPDERGRLDPGRRLGAVPAQTFVTPAFAGYPSGHSTFSRAAAEVLTAFTGDRVLPRRPRPASRSRRASCCTRKARPQDTTIQWATYFDAADQAGISRLFMGIHVPSDDFEGRKIGATCGKDAMALALRYFNGTATP